MIRRIALTAGAAALAFGGLAAGVGANQAFAGAPPVNAHGILNCTASAKIKDKPALTLTGGGGPTTLTTSITLTCSGANGITSGKGKLVSNAPDNNAVNLQVSPPSSTGTIKWKGAQKVTASTITFSSSSADVASKPWPITHEPGPGTVTITGSFAGEGVTAVYQLDQTTAALTTLATGKGIKGESFTGVNGVSTFAIG